MFLVQNFNGLVLYYIKGGWMVLKWCFKGGMKVSLISGIMMRTVLPLSILMVSTLKYISPSLWHTYKCQIEQSTKVVILEFSHG